MSKFHRVLAALSIWPLIAIPAAAQPSRTGGSARSSAARPERFVLYEVGKGGGRENFRVGVVPILAVTRGRPGSLQQFGSPALPAGQRFDVLMGGKVTATARIISWKAASSPGCPASGVAQELPGQEMEINAYGLAAVPGFSLPRGLPPREPSSAEKEASTEFARGILTEESLPADALSDLNLGMFAAHRVGDLDHDQRVELISSFLVRSQAADRYYSLLLVLGRGPGGRRVATIASVRRSRAGHLVDERVRDHLDLDGDGIDEIIAVVGDVVGQQLTLFPIVYGLRNGRWTVIYEGAPQVHSC